MKVEIEDKDLVSLNNELEAVKKENRQLINKLMALDEKQLKKSSIDLAATYFKHYMEAVFKKLGFSTSALRDVQLDREMLNNEYWYGDKNLKIKISAAVAEEFKRAFMHIGIREEIMTDSLKEERYS